MFILRNKKRDKKYNREYESIFLAKSVRENGKSKHEIILNITQWAPSQIIALEKGLKGKIGIDLNEVDGVAGKQFGGLWVLKQIAKRLGILESLGSSKEAELAMLLIIGRILTQGSRLHLCEWGENQAIEAILGIASYNEDDLYETLDWLSRNQLAIEKRLFNRNHQEKPTLFLYDITSSYFEGVKNELADYGYNRDQKKHKKQIVIGLITDQNGMPIAIEVFKGNTSDSTTVIEQIEKLAEEFEVKEITFVGDRGMIKKMQITHINREGYQYITAITKAQIETLMSKGVIQLGLFDERVTEIIDKKEPGIRYILKKNPIRAKEMAQIREEKLQTFIKKIQESNDYLQEHPRAFCETQIKKLTRVSNQLKLTPYLKIAIQTERTVEMIIDQSAYEEAIRLDGCYVLKTNLSSEQLNAEDVHQRYKDLAFIEHTFRTLKTGHLEVRPIFVRKESRTRGHVLVTMLAYMIVQYFWKHVQHLGYTLENAIASIAAIQPVTLSVADQAITIIPKQPTKIMAILSAINLKLPKTFHFDPSAS
jgi:transposase